jgi:DNA-binding transcriptional MerR regulator/methylmalonyl-CoA mutase cobalamin-binding subunit
MRVVTRRTGLSVDVLRAWERRHQVVSPSRSPSGHRLYSDRDIERLLLLYRATLAGRSIGQVAPLDGKVLAELVLQDAAADVKPGAHAVRPAARAARTPPHSATDYLGHCLRAIRRLDAPALAATLRHAAIALHASEDLDSLVASLLDHVGTGWRPGTLAPVQAHLARAVLRRTLEGAIEEAGSPAARAGVVIATPVGEVHEFSALLAALSAAVEGWRVTYLGASLPAEHIAQAAVLTRARAVALSVERPAVDPSIGDEFRRLRRAMPRRVALLVCGAASAGYRSTLDEIGAIHPPDLAELRSQLRLLRRRR